MASHNATCKAAAGNGAHEARILAVVRREILDDADERAVRALALFGRKERNEHEKARLVLRAGARAPSPRSSADKSALARVAAACRSTRCDCGRSV